MNKEYSPVIVYLHDTQTIIDAAASLLGKSRSEYIREEMSEVSAQVIERVLAPVAGDDNE